VLRLIPIFLISVLFTSIYPLYYVYAKSSSNDDSDNADVQASSNDDSDNADVQASNKDDGHNDVKEKKDHHDCPDGKKWNGDGCEPQCPDGKKWNGDGCEPQCPDGKKWNGDGCEPPCPDGKKLEQGQCIDQNQNGRGCVAPRGQNVINYRTQECLPPISDAGPDKEVKVGDKIKLDGSGSKAQNEDGKIVSYQWMRDSDDCSNAKLTDQDKNIATFIALGGSESCSYTFDLQVTDDNGLSDTDRVTVHTKSIDSSTSNQTSLHIELSQSVVEVGKSITISGLLAQGNDKTKKGLGGEMISFTGNGYNYPQNVPTQSDGSFSIQTKSPLVLGKWDVQAHISGESKFGSISSNIVNYRTQPIHIEAGDITFQNQAKNNESLTGNTDQHDLPIPVKQDIKNGCIQVGGKDFYDKLDEIGEEGGHLKYNVKDKSSQKTIYYEINFSCKYSILSKLTSSQLSEVLSSMVEISPSVSTSLGQKKVN